MSISSVYISFATKSKDLSMISVSSKMTVCSIESNFCFRVLITVYSELSPLWCANIFSSCSATFLSDS